MCSDLQILEISYNHCPNSLVMPLATIPDLDDINYPYPVDKLLPAQPLSGWYKVQRIRNTHSSGFQYQLQQ
jgi:hypothetical protein